MNNKNLTFVFFLLILGCRTQQFTYYPLPELSDEIQEELSISMFEENRLYMARTVVTNEQYRYYQEWLRENDQLEKFNNSVLDTNAWNHEPAQRYYHSHTGYANYPVTTVSQEQARMYCRWKENRLNELIKISNNHNIAKVNVRLPTEREWIKAARKGLPDNVVFPWEGNSPRMSAQESRRFEGKFRLNFMRNPLSDTLYESSTLYNIFPAPVNSYWPNGIGLYNMSGNVAEWINETGKTKGGAFNQTLYYSQIDSEGLNDGDSSARKSTGFRYIVEVVKFKSYNNDQHFDFNNNYFQDNFKLISHNDSMKKILYAHSKQVTNKEYRQFLKENSTSELRVRNENWRDYSDQKWLQYYSIHEMFNDLPVVNITFKAANEYCKWLTVNYNVMPDRKYDSVIFRLPDEIEWEIAARGGKKFSLFPWGGPYAVNHRGFYLANFHPLEERFLKMNIENEVDNNITHDEYRSISYYYDYPDDNKSISRGLDGGDLTVPVNSYYPNAFGLYNIVGNSAEKINEEGISKGGSWNSFRENIAITSRETYTDANPMTGFRVFMEVIVK